MDRNLIAEFARALLKDLRLKVPGRVVLRAPLVLTGSDAMRDAVLESLASRLSNQDQRYIQSMNAETRLLLPSMV